MDMDLLIKKAGILVEALPYIQKLRGKTIVVKYGGNAMISEELKNFVMEDLILLKYVGANPILVHGGGPDITAALKQYNVESEFINGLRVTDEQTVGIAQMVLVGKTNKSIVSLINKHGGKAIGICGIDGNLIKCKKLTRDEAGNKIDIGYVGDIVSINGKMLKLLSDDEYIPVIAPIGVDDNAQSYNINADTVASRIACAMKAEKLIMLTDTPGILDKEKNILAVLSKQEVAERIADETISGGMIPKVNGCTEAIDHGVSRVHIIDGRVPHCILLEMFTDKGIGTMITE